jgi:SulP family sulfate permease
MSLTSALRKVPLATALSESLSAGYGLKSLRADLVAGLIVSLVALPLAMALSIAVGLPPQNGLYTAIIAGLFAAIFGGSRTQVSGPTAAFVVIVAPIVAEFGMRGIVWCEIIAGLLLLCMGISRMGKIISYIPYPVTLGFTAGIAVVIGTISLNDFLGIAPAPAGHWPHKISAIISSLPQTDWPTLIVGLLSFAIMVVMARVTNKVPAGIIGIVAATLLSVALTRSGIEIETIGSRFNYTDLTGALQHGVPPFPPSLHIPAISNNPVFDLPTLAELSAWFMPALVIAALAGLESLLSATVADSMNGSRHDPDAELNGIGLANIFSGFFLGIPATGAIARTATNINAGAISPIASITHALLLLMYMLFLSPLISYIPMSALSALLLLTAWRMSHARQFTHLLKTAPHSDRAVLICCFLMTVMIDMVAGVVSGLVLACLLFLRRLSEVTQIDYHHAESNRSGHPLPHDVLMLRIDGPLFFGTAEKTLNLRPDYLLEKTRTIIVDMSNVPVMDVTALDMLEKLARELENKQKAVILCVRENVSKKIVMRLGASFTSKVKLVSSVNEALLLLEGK